MSRRDADSPCTRCLMLSWCRPGVWPVRSLVTTPGHSDTLMTVSCPGLCTGVTLQCIAGECGLRKRWLVRLPVASNWGQIDSHLPWPVWTPFSGHVCVPSCFWCTFYWPPPTCFHNFYLFEGNMLEGGLTCHHSLLNSPNRSQQISLFCISPEWLYFILCSSIMNKTFDDGLLIQ